MMRANSSVKWQVWTGALIGALAAFVVAVTGHVLLWMQAGDGYESTGATQGLDLWTYYSMARAVWRSPNGITYSYPYELYWPTASVIFQLPITVLAWLGRLTSLPMAFEIGRVVGGAGAGAALGSIGALFPRGFWRRWFYIAAVLGGGLFSLASVAMAIETAGLPGLTEPYQYQPEAMGRLMWWLPYLASNLRMPLECLYHAMVIGALACLIRRRYGWAWLLGLVSWMSNPFAAVALHGAVLSWFAWRMVESRGSRRRYFAMHLLAWMAVNLAAAVYYGWFLNQWLLLRELHALYRIQHVPALEWWRLALLTMPYGAALMATLFMRSLRRAVWGRPVWRLFAILAVVHLLLIQQSAVLGDFAMQSYHYNRGYLHLGLVVVFWRVLMIILRKFGCLGVAGCRDIWRPWKIRDIRCRAAGIAMCSMVALTCLDQVFFAMCAVFNHSMVGLVDAEYAQLVEAIPSEPAPVVVFTAQPNFPGSYITAFSPHVAWNASETMIVPFTNERRTLFEEAIEGRHGGMTGLGISYAIIYRDNENRLAKFRFQNWTPVANTGNLVLLKGPKIIPGTRQVAPEELELRLNQ